MTVDIPQPRPLDRLSLLPCGAASSAPLPTCNRERSGRGVSATHFPTHPLPQNGCICFFIRTHPLEVRWSWDCGAVVIPLILSSSWTPSLRVHCRPGWRHPPSPCKEPEGRTRRTKRVVAHSAPFMVSRPTIDHPKSVFLCPRTS